jgi:hypothetical protein
MATAKDPTAIAAWLVLAGVIVTVPCTLGSVFDGIASDPHGATVIVLDRDADNEFGRACGQRLPSKHFRDQGTCRPVPITVP